MSVDMVQLMLREDVLIIDGSKAPIIFSWEHRSFFKTGLGFEHDERRQQYILSESPQLHQTIFQSVNYLKEENIHFQVDSEVDTLIKQIENEQQDFEKALKIGEKFLNNSLPKIIPIGIKRNLKPYQLEGLTHLYNIKNGANFSVPGSGKTTVVYAVFSKLRQENQIEKMLVVGPLSCFQPWEDESQLCLDKEQRIIRITGGKTSRQSIYLQASDYDIFLCSYQTLVNDIKEIINICRKYKVLMVIDESHNIKNIDGGKRAEAVLNISRYTIRRVILSGTPVPNSYLDLWTQMTFLWPGEQLLGDRNSFRYLCEDSGVGRKIRKAIKPFFFRTTKKELNLPLPVLNYIDCDLQPYQEQIYRSLSIKYLNELNLMPLDRMRLREWRKAKLVRLIQTASNPSLLSKYSDEFNIPPITSEGLSIVDLIDKYPLYEIPSKVDMALKIVHDLIDQDEKIIIWTTFIHNIRMLQELLRDFNPFIVYGGVPRDENEDEEFNREQQIRYFKKATGGAVLIANPAACAESISLHKVCHNAVYLDRTFNCGQYLQSKDRIHRIGLSEDEKVTYHILIAKNTIDETIERRLLEKELRMLEILENDLPVGSFDVEEKQLGQSDDEEKVDFDETFKDIRNQIG